MPATAKNATATKTVARSSKVPEHVKQPADRKPKASVRPKPAVEQNDDGITVTHYGVTVLIDPAALNDYELLEDSASEEPTALPSVLRRLLGDEQVGQVKESLRDPDTGRIPLEGEHSISSWLEDVFEAINPS